MARKKSVKGVTEEGAKLPSVPSVEFSQTKRRHEVSTRYLKGMTQAIIAQELGVSVNTVADDLKKVKEEWLAEYRQAFEDRKAQELAKIDEIERMAWRGWEKSIERQEVSRTLKETVRQGVRNEDNKIVGHRMVPVKVVEETVVKGQSGDPRFLEQAAKCVEMRLRILGLWKGDQQVLNQVTLDWTSLFKAQEVRSQRGQELHQGRLMGEVLEVETTDRAKEMTYGPSSEPVEQPGAAHSPPEKDPVEARIEAEERGHHITLKE